MVVINGHLISHPHFWQRYVLKWLLLA